MTTVITPEHRSARRIAAILEAPPAHWVGDGFLVHGYFSLDPQLARALSPFLLLDYHAPHVYPPTTNMRRGVGPHPHRGFETVTIAFEGSVAHHDSTGAGGTIGPGDVQWMTAAGGILHKEYHEAAFARAGGRMHMMQIWVNLPAADKTTPPGYQLLASSTIANVPLANDGGIVRVVAGEYDGVAGAAQTFSSIDMLDARLNAGGRMELDGEPSRNAAVLVMNGSARINGVAVAKARDFVVFANDGRTIAIEATAPGTHLMVLTGAPIDEPISQYGPFVMNTHAEIREAIADFNAGRFGRLAD
jgi:redox-sensitive bicupin YhaK (pirin superfamily)